ncbi:hypothetical protein GGR57DRAFT_514264 [Xylariaceae sp. FL1272]|nr:hypothetical protein GGR57DRAFT_514264 [Xylariaceae sp. FL1272]
MSFPYSSSPHSGAAMDVTQHTYVPNYPPQSSSSMEVRPPQQPVHSTPPLPAQIPAPFLPPSAYLAPAIHTPLAKRRESHAKALKLKRSHSTPNVRPQGMNDSDNGNPGMSGEKKRNRLGYARSNMACGNCRKRKIRCQAIKNDDRCYQCIRLKKPCAYYAVDQGPTDPSIIKPDTRAVLASTATSPPMLSSHLADVRGAQPSIPAGQAMRPQTLRTEPYLEETKDPQSMSHVRSYPYGQSGIGSWTPTDTTSNIPKPNNMTGWRNYPPESPVTSSFGQYPGPPPPTSATWAATSSLEAVSSSEETWTPYQTSIRSMSFGGEEVTQYTNDRRTSIASDIYQPTSIESVSSTSYAAWQQPYQQSWYVEGGQSQSATENHSPIDSMYYER